MNNICIILLITILIVYLIVKGRESFKDGDYTTLDDYGKLFDISNKPGSADKTSKFHDYLSTYEYVLHEYPRNINLLEIGIAKGESLFTWAAFYNKGKIYGLDTQLNDWNASKNELQKIASDNNIQLGEILVFQGSGFEENELFSTFPNFDIIIDDATHIAVDQIIAFEMFFPTKLNDGGTYIIEDVFHRWDLNQDGGSTFKPLKKYLDSLMPYIWLCEDVNNWLDDPTVTYRQKCGPRNQGRKFIDEFVKTNNDWRYKIKSINFYMNLIIIKKR